MIRNAMFKQGVLAGLLLLLTTGGCWTEGAHVKKKKDPVKQSDFHYKLARNYLDSHNIPMVLQELRHALDLNPNNADAHYLRGFVLMGRNDLEGAVMEFRRTLEIDPKYYPARNNLGSAYIAMGRYKKAIETLKPLLTEEMYPTPYLAEGNMGWAWYKLHEYAKAEAHLKRAVFLQPNFCLGWDELGIVLRAEGRLDEALLSLEQAIKKCPKYAEPHLYKGLILEAQGYMDKAQKAYEQCAKLGGASPVGRRCKARMGK